MRDAEVGEKKEFQNLKIAGFFGSQKKDHMECFIRQSPKDLSIPDVPKGYSFLVRMEGDATFARELLSANDIILRFVNLKIWPRRIRRWRPHKVVLRL